MAYKCPRCGEAVRRGSSTTAVVAGGMVGALIVAAFGAFQCPKCGKIPKSEFPPEVQSKMTMGSLALVGSAIALFVVVVVILIAIQAMR